MTCPNPQCKAQGNKRVCEACEKERGKDTMDALMKALGAKRKDGKLYCSEGHRLCDNPAPTEREKCKACLQQRADIAKQLPPHFGEMRQRPAKITFSISGVPVGKGRPRFGNGHCFTPEKTRRYEQAVKVAFLQAAPGFAPLEGPVSLMVSAYFPMPKKGVKEHDPHTKRPDADNVLKAIADALNGLAWEDDEQVCVAGVTKRYSATPEVIVTVEELSKQ